MTKDRMNTGDHYTRRRYDEGANNVHRHPPGTRQTYGGQRQDYESTYGSYLYGHNRRSYPYHQGNVPDLPVRNGYYDSNIDYKSFERGNDGRYYNRFENAGLGNESRYENDVPTSPGHYEYSTYANVNPGQPFHGNLPRDERYRDFGRQQGGNDGNNPYARYGEGYMDRNRLNDARNNFIDEWEPLRHSHPGSARDKNGEINFHANRHPHSQPVASYDPHHRHHGRNDWE